MQILRLGMKGPDVELLQAGLIRAGFSDLIIDGVFGDSTKQAVKNFQQQNNLNIDGVFGPITYTVLYPYLSRYVRYQIKNGDTLYHLAHAFKSSMEAIEIANPSINIYQLKAGQVITVPLQGDVVFTNVSFTTTVLDICIDGLLKRYPFITKIIIGQSALKQNIYALKIGSGTKKVAYNAAHHANEWITSVLLMKFLEQYAKGISYDLEILDYNIKDLFEQATIYLIPLVNPDGVNLTTGLFDEESIVYKNAKDLNFEPLPFPNEWKANINGVDLNLNYPARFEQAKDIKFAQGYISPGPCGYVGPYPLSEPESVSMAVFTLQHQFKLVISFHTQGEMIYWRFSNFSPPRSCDIVHEFEKISGYKVSETPSEIGFASYKDWFIQTFNLPGYTIEAGLATKPLSISDFEKVYRDNLGILILGPVLA